MNRAHKQAGCLEKTRVHYSRLNGHKPRNDKAARLAYARGSWCSLFSKKGYSSLKIQFSSGFSASFVHSLWILWLDLLRQADGCKRIETSASTGGDDKNFSKNSLCFRFARRRGCCVSRRGTAEIQWDRARARSLQSAYFKYGDGGARAARVEIVGLARQQSRIERFRRDGQRPWPLRARGRVLDLSTGAFKRLYGGLGRGVGPVCYRVMK